MGPFGSDIKTDNFVESGVPVIRGGNLNQGRFNGNDFVYLTEKKADELSNAIAFPGDIIFTHRGTLGQVGLIPKGEHRRYIVSQSQMKLSCNRRLADPLFIYYFFKSPSGQYALLANTSQTGVPAISRPITSLKAIRIPLPPLPEQKAIARILGTLDDKIELNRRMNATLESIARALFQSWFVDFDPVHAKAAGRQPAGMDAATAALFPAGFQDSALGEIPEGWTAEPLPEVIEVNPRRTLSKGTVAPYLDMKNLPKQGHSAEEIIVREFTSGTKFQNGDTLLARITPCLENGKTGFVDFLQGGQVGWGSTEYIVFAPKPPLPPQFGYLLARSDALRSHAIQNMTGTSGRQRVPSDCFKTFWLAVPPPEIAQRFDELTTPLMAKIKANSTQSRALATLRDTLLPKLLSREISCFNLNPLISDVRS